MTSIQTFNSLYSPATHPYYEGSHVVISAVPLAELHFQSEDDVALRRDVDQRDPSTCPRTDSLVAVPADPPVVHAERLQQLTVWCDARASTAAGMAICTELAAQHGLTPDDLQRPGLDAEQRKAISCPFASLVGAITIPNSPDLKVMLNAFSPLKHP